MLRTLLKRGAVLCAVSTAVNLASAAAQDFRVESKVFAAQEEAPTAESLTLFTDGRAYDFLTTPRETTVFDLSRGRIVLLDPARRVKTELTTQEVTEFAEQLRTRAQRQTNALLKFAASPSFEESRDEAGRLQFASPLMTYRVSAAKPDNAAAVRVYREFSDWSARLNAMLDPGARPPFPRLAVNAALERAGVVPEKVEVTIAAQNRLLGKPTILRSEHALTTRLLSEDRRRIDEAGHMLATFQLVSLDEYRRPVLQAKR